MRPPRIVPVATVGLLLCLSAHNVSANVFKNMRPRNAPGNGDANGNANTRVNRNRNNPRNVPTVRHNGPENVRAMRRHYKFPLIKRALDAESKAYTKGVGAKWKDVVQSDSSKKESKPAARPAANGGQSEEEKPPGRPNKPTNANEVEATTSTEQKYLFSLIEEEPKSEIEEQLVAQKKQQIEEQLAAAQELYATENADIMDITSTFVPPPAAEVFTDPDQTQQQRRNTPMIVAWVIAVTCMAGLALVVVRRTPFAREVPRNILAANIPIRMIDEDGDPIDLASHYGIASLGGSRSSAETRASMGFHL
eukprot:CAMPEP_0185801350 /NCGR_PEP_ID=MMETSP1322-20130828/1384_1 /TAXON_ID=265543 /ORGANISM="Minutocellus polymorphus, Strain RCC2270" /LENGTH=307 /DNA_ID=CAMNT_0028497039 /DNA_START=23 /DNA_END=946 /DNA_ORIENTATION=+